MRSLPTTFSKKTLPDLPGICHVETDTIRVFYAVPILLVGQGLLFLPFTLRENIGVFVKFMQFKKDPVFEWLALDLLRLIARTYACTSALNQTQLCYSPPLNCHFSLPPICDQHLYPAHIMPVIYHVLTAEIF